METDYQRRVRLEAEKRSFAQAMHGWNHPANIAWAASRDIAGAESLRDWCRRLENRLRDVEATSRRASPDAPSQPYLEEVTLPGHRGFPDMAMSDRLWLVDPLNRGAVANVWDCIVKAPLCIMGTYGYLTSDQLEDAGIRETLISHWRRIDYTETGERVETIPGSMIAYDLGLLGLGRRDIENGTARPLQRRPAAGRPSSTAMQTKPARRQATTRAAPKASGKPLVIEWCDKAVSRGT